MKKILVPIFALLIITAVWAQADAQEPQGKFTPPFWGNNLNLTPEQQDKLFDIQDNYRKESQKIWLDMSKKELELKELYMADKIDLKKVERVEDQMRDLMDKKFDLAREHRNAMRGLLTTEQLNANPNAFICPGFGMGPCMGGSPGIGGGGGMGPGFGTGGGPGGSGRGGGFWR